MNTCNSVERLRGVGLLDWITDGHPRQLASIAVETKFPAGKALLRVGALAKTVYLLIQGSLSLGLSAPGVGCRRTMAVEDGELSGWSSLPQFGRLTAATRELMGIAAAIKSSAASLLALFEDSLALGFKFMRHSAHGLAKRLSDKRMRLFHLSEAYGAEISPAE